MARRKKFSTMLFPDIAAKRDETLKVRDVAPKQTPDLTDSQKEDLKAYSSWDRMLGSKEIGDNGEVKKQIGTYSPKEEEYSRTRDVVEKDEKPANIKWKKLMN